MFIQNDDETVLTCVNFNANILVNIDIYIYKNRILVMNTILDQYKTPYEVLLDIACNMVKRRKERKLTQKQLSEQSE